MVVAWEDTLFQFCQFWAVKEEGFWIKERKENWKKKQTNKQTKMTTLGFDPTNLLCPKTKSTKYGGWLLTSWDKENRVQFCNIKGELQQKKLACLLFSTPSQNYQQFL